METERPVGKTDVTALGQDVAARNLAETTARCEAALAAAEENVQRAQAALAAAEGRLRRAKEIQEQFRERWQQIRQVTAA